TAEGSLPNTAEGSLQKTAEGSLPNTAEGSLQKTAEGSLPNTAEGSLTSGIDMSAFDRSVAAQDDFFAYVNGGWINRTELPADRARWGSFDELREKSNTDVRALIEQVSAAKNAEAGSPEQKIRDYYNAYLDTQTATKNGSMPLKAELDSIAALSSHHDLYALFSVLGAYGVNNPMDITIFSDFKDPDTNVVYLNESGLSLPDRDYYLEDTEQYQQGRRLFTEYVAGLFALAGIKEGAAKAQHLLMLEKQLAQVHWTREENRDPVKGYNPKTLAQLKSLAPLIEWEVFFESAGIPERDFYVLSQPSYFAALGEIITNSSLDTWKDYLTFQLLNRFSSVMGDEYFNLSFLFYRAGLQGVEAPRPVWKRAVNSINANMGELLGQLYVEKHYTEASRERMQVMIEFLISAYQKSISELEWMSEATKIKALKKLSKFTPKIGHPDKWRDYSKLHINADDMVGNSKRASLFGNDRALAKLDEAVDKTEWFMNPQTVNAYYNPVWNEIVFPASILQPPFFNVLADDAVNYGGIGAVIGHEIGHGFDDQGRKFDGDGNLRDWWTEVDSARFEKLKDKLAAQYNSYVVIDDLTVNGEFTSGENIGDLGGLSIAYKAYKLSLAGRVPPVIDGLSGDQRFFMGWAQVWRGIIRDEETKRLLTVDPHSPAKFRTNGAAVNVSEFYRAFDVKEGDAMYLPPDQRVKIW
ncbi:MAG: M13 family metallopeptidase, partial [Pseudomonadales bacterium]|nr:M13 family metallopeptidase [Pseudomonadales bacterium]